MFPHVLGMTEGLQFLASRLDASGHRVHVQDLFAGRTFDDVDAGVAWADRIGHDAIEDLARRASRAHRSATVVMGFSLGTFPAQLLAQEVRHVGACVLVGGAQDPAALHGHWRYHVDLSVHAAQPDEWLDGDALAALLRHAPDAEVHRYAGAGHLFFDPSCADYDADAADLFEERLLTWLDRAGATPPGP